MNRIDLVRLLLEEEDDFLAKQDISRPKFEVIVAGIL
jgi:hypothetical protein